jgi:N-hydroxyarylamine O-acetyltransferase
MPRQSLDSYFERIGWSGTTAPTLETLSTLLAAHMRAIPFENLDVLTGQPVKLDIASLREKLITAHRGGYCFEHATLFAHILERIGFRVTRHSARVVLFFPRHEVGRLHMFLTVELPQGVFVADPGFGGPASLAPIPLTGPAPPPEATHWMARDGDDWFLRTQTGNAWVSTLEADNPIDFEIANYYTATHPSSPFRNRLMLSRFTQDGRISVMNRDVTLRHGAQTQTFQLANRTALQTLLTEHFGFDYGQADQLRVPFIPEWG